MREAEAFRAALGGVGSSWTNFLDRHNRNMGHAGDTAVSAGTIPSVPPVSVSGMLAVGRPRG